MPALNEFLPPLLGGFLFASLFTPMRIYLDVEDELFGTIDTSRLGVVNFETVILAREIQTLSPFEPGIYQRHFNSTVPEK